MTIKPLDLGLDLLARAEDLAHLAGTPNSAKHCLQTDVLRASWTFTAAAVDTYFHERVRNALLEPPLSASAEKYSIPLGATEEIISAFLEDRIKVRPRVRLKRIVHDALLKDTFQGSRNIEKAFSLMGISGYWSTIAADMGATSSDIKSRLDSQYHRRNLITHQGDYKRQERRQHIWYQNLGRPEVNAEIDWTRNFLMAANKT